MRIYFVTFLARKILFFWLENTLIGTLRMRIDFLQQKFAICIIYD